MKAKQYAAERNTTTDAMGVLAFLFTHKVGDVLYVTPERGDAIYLRVISKRDYDAAK